MIPAKNAEFYEAVRLLAGTRFSLGSPCECAEFIREPPRSIGQLLVALDNIKRAADQLKRHIKRYHRKDLETIDLQGGTKKINMAKTHISPHGMAIGKAKVMATFEKHEPGSWLNYRMIEITAGKSASRGKSYEYGFAGIYVRALVEEGALTRRKMGNTLYFAVKGSKSPTALTPPTIPVPIDVNIKPRTREWLEPNKTPDERTRVYTLPIEDHRTVKTIAALFGITNDEVLHQAIKSLKDKIKGTVL